MNWSEFLQKVPKNVPFTVEQASVFFPGVRLKSIRQNFFNWKRQKRLIKLRRDLYVIKDGNLDLTYLANMIYEPSYISLEYALSFYSLIPEAAFQVTSVTPNKTARFYNEFGIFAYRHLKPELYFGYNYTGNVLIADREKCLLDYFYLNLAKASFGKDFLESLRLQNLRQLNRAKLKRYLKKFNVKKLNKIMGFFLTHDE